MVSGVPRSCRRGRHRARVGVVRTSSVAASPSARVISAPGADVIAGRLDRLATPASEARRAGGWITVRRTGRWSGLDRSPPLSARLSAVTPAVLRRQAGRDWKKSSKVVGVDASLAESVRRCAGCPVSATDSLTESSTFTTRDSHAPRGRWQRPLRASDAKAQNAMPGRNRFIAVPPSSDHAGRWRPWSS